MIFDQAAYYDGKQAFHHAARPEDCPHDIGSDAGKSWLKGYWDAAALPYMVVKELYNE